MSKQALSSEEGKTIPHVVIRFGVVKAVGTFYRWLPWEPLPPKRGVRFPSVLGFLLKIKGVFYERKEKKV